MTLHFTTWLASTPLWSSEQSLCSQHNCGKKVTLCMSYKENLSIPAGLSLPSICRTKLQWLKSMPKMVLKASIIFWYPTHMQCVLMLGVCAPLVVLFHAFLLITSACFLSSFVTWLVAIVLHCYSLFGLFVDLKFSCPVTFLFSLLHWAPGLSSIVFSSI